MQKSNDLLLLSSLSPILYGIYSDGKLISSFQTQEKTLDALLKVFALIKENKIKRVFYANGPGSFTAIKLTHIFLQTLQIIEGIELFCVDSFYFNANAPIRAFGNQYFLKTQEGIVLQSFQEDPYSVFMLPKELRVQDFSLECEPLYVLPALKDSF